MSNVLLQNVVSRNLPEFVREDYPAFVEFIKAYYEYLDVHDKRDIQNLRDIDETLDSFIEYFKGELGYSTAEYQNIDLRLFLRKSKQIFTAKGTEESYKFLFRILFGKPVEVTYPWDSVLKASDGKWNRDTSVFIKFQDTLRIPATKIIVGNIYRIEEVNTTDFTLCGAAANIPNSIFVATATATGSGIVTTSDYSQTEDAALSFSGNQVNITSPGKYLKVFVDRVVHVRGRIWELLINKNYYGNIEIGDIVSFGGYEADICPTSVGYRVLAKGRNYRVGDLITSTTIANGAQVTQTVKVTEVDSVGGIVALAIIKFACDYTNNFYVLTTKAKLAEKSNIDISRDSVSVFDSPDDSSVGSYYDYGTFSKQNYWTFDYASPAYIGDIIASFYNETVNNSVDIADIALIEFFIGGVAKYQGYYISNDGFLSDSIVLQDSKYYQKFSYVLTVDETIESYRSYIKSFIHSAGTAMYGEYQITNTYNPGISGQMILSVE